MATALTLSTPLLAEAAPSQYKWGNIGVVTNAGSYMGQWQTDEVDGLQHPYEYANTGQSFTKLSNGDATNTSTAIGSDGAIYLFGSGPQNKHDIPAGADNDARIYYYTAKMTAKGHRFVSVASGQEVRGDGTTNTITTTLLMVDNEGNLWGSRSMGGEQLLSSNISGTKFAEVYSNGQEGFFALAENGTFYSVSVGGDVIGVATLAAVPSLNGVKIRQATVVYPVSTLGGIAAVDTNGSVWVAPANAYGGYSQFSKISDSGFTEAFPMSDGRVSSKPFAIGIKSDGLYAIGQTANGCPVRADS